MNFAVLQFPASNCDQDAVHVLRNVLGHSARLALAQGNQSSATRTPSSFPAVSATAIICAPAPLRVSAR